MDKDEAKDRPKASRIAAVGAIAMWPVGVILGLLLASGQDSAGATLGFVMGLAFALVSSVLLGVVAWFFNSPARARVVSRYRRGILSVLSIALAAVVAWYVYPLVGDQQYSLRVKNFSSREFADVEILFAGITVPVGRVAAGSEIHREGFEKRPTGAVTVFWVDDDRTRHSVRAESAGGPPRQYDGGQLVVNILSGDEIHTYFLVAR